MADDVGLFSPEFVWLDTGVLNTPQSAINTSSDPPRLQKLIEGIVTFDYLPIVRTHRPRLCLI